ncbi:hypothetical protein ACIQFU_10245 [Streptomyces sp. NPDC093065]|uniref:hypothetical protein n=1 Tax=Streptomyces sp. NPDC093065 TaxID=3366021 RepID=UPI003824E065
MTTAQQADDRIRQLHPGIGDYALTDRRFPGLAVRRLADDHGIRCSSAPAPS